MEIPLNNQTEFLIFYSWQSDLPKQTNQHAIRRALRHACDRIEDDGDIKLKLDEATRGTSGSPNIPATILEKISSCDLFVCDLTTINSSAGEKFRKTPNPNVIFELGYAVSILGWSRVLMLFNKNFGKFPDDLPFDIDRHRATPYMLSEEDPKNKSNVSSLQSVLKTAICEVIVKNPKRPSEIARRSPEETKRERDIENISRVFLTIHLPTVDQMIESLPNQLIGNIFHFWESFKGVVRNSHFYLYDLKAEQLIHQVYLGWDGCLSHGEHYRDSPNPNLYIFSSTYNVAMTQNQINESRLLLRNSLDQLLDYIRQEYIEIDIDQLSSNAWAEYVDYMREDDYSAE